MAAHIAAVVAGPSLAAYPEPNYATFTPALPKLSRKRKQPSLDTLSSTDALYGRAVSSATLELTDSSVSDIEEPEPPVGCFANLKSKLKSLFFKKT